MSETGSVKFKARQEATALVEFPGFEPLNRYRSKLWQLRLLGVDADGIGYGNVSMRERGDQQFYISGSGTGHKAELKLTDYAKVVAWDFAKNCLRYAGTTMASSESLTHASIYEADPEIGAVIHGHSLNLWSTLLKEGPATPAAIEYGTPDMARAVRHLFATTNVRERRAFAMAGHREGVLFFGRNLEEAFSVLRELDQP